MKRTIRVSLAGSMLTTVVLAQSACTSVAVRNVDPPILTQHQPAAHLEVVDALALTPEMQAFVERYVMPYDDRLKLSLLMLAVADKGVLGFRYNEVQTLTAAEAFQQRSGNCVAFANLFVALARSAGLQARFQEIQVEPEWSNRGDVLLVTKHINVEVRTPTMAYMIDVSGQKFSPDAPRRLLSDQEALALFYNNLGAEAMIAGDMATAYARFAQAIEAAPEVPDTWSNLGVLLRRNGQFDEAALAYHHTLVLDKRSMAAMGNLHDLYLDHGHEAEAAQLDHRVARYRRDNPYFLWQESETAMDEGRLEEAERMLNKAVRMKKTEPLLYYSLARLDILRGDDASARAHIRKARELTPSGQPPDLPESLRESVRQMQSPASSPPAR